MDITQTDQVASYPDNSETDLLDIPLLDNKVEAQPAEALPAPIDAGKKRKENPFLPYAQLEQLAKERERFRQDLELFTQRLQQQGHPQAKVENISQEFVGMLAQQVLEQLRPQIEQIITDQLRGKTAPMNTNPFKGSPLK